MPFLLIAFFVISCSKDDASASITTSSSTETISFKSQNVTAAISQREILQTILDANPNNTLDWNLATTKNLGDLTGVTTNTQGIIIELDLTEKMLSVLPPETWSLIKLRYLNLSSNQLTSIPAGIKNLINLKYLNLNHNKLLALPQEVSLLTNLEEIGLFEN